MAVRSTVSCTTRIRDPTVVVGRACCSPCFARTFVRTIIDGMLQNNYKTLSIFWLQLYLYSTLVTVVLALSPVETRNEYAMGETIPLFVNKVFSSQTFVPYDYYELPVCKPPSIRQESAGLEAVLRGDRLSTPPIEVAAPS